MNRWVNRGAPNYPFVLNRESNQAKGLVAWWPTLASKGATNALRDLGGVNDAAFVGGTTQNQRKDLLFIIPVVENGNIFIPKNE